MLAREQGPSCSHIKQVPDLKLIYVRFISDRSCAHASWSNIVEDSLISSQVGERSTGKRQYENSVSYTEVKRRAYSVPGPKKAVMHKPVPPKSISVTQMLKLGKVVKSPEVVNLYNHLNRMTWSTIPKPAEFNISKDLLGEGAFRRAYKAHANDKELSAFTWVVKEYTTNAFNVISETKQSVEKHSKKVV